MNLHMKHPVCVLGYAAVVSGLFTGAIMALHAATSGIVERNERLFEQRALVELFDLGDPKQLGDDDVLRLVEENIRRDRSVVDPETGLRFEVIEAWRETPDGSRTLTAIAFPIWGAGFWARVDGLLAVTPNLEEVVGIVFLSHTETPGLGGRITEKSWRDTFKGLRVTPPPTGEKYIAIDAAPPSAGDPREGRHVDAITGATGTSRAVEAFLNVRIAQFRRAMATDRAGKEGR